MLELSRKVGDRATPQDGDLIRKLAADVGAMTDALCELRQEGKGASPQVGRSPIYLSLLRSYLFVVVLFI